MTSKETNPIGSDWRDFKRTLLTQEERDAIDAKVHIISALIDARRAKGYSQRELEAASGVKQPVIARIERDTSDPQLTTILKILRPLGKTLQIVPLPDDEKAEAVSV